MFERGERRRIQRVRAAAATGILAGVLALVACGQSSEPNASSVSESSSVDQGWTFTDGRGDVLELDTVPQDIVAYEESAAYLMGLGVTPVGVFGSTPIDENPYFEGLDMAGIESLGEVYGEVNLEKTAALQPDLIVTTHYFPDAPSWGFTNEKQINTIEEIAPMVSIARDASPATILDSYGALAESIGADLEAPEIIEGIDRYEAAIETLSGAAEANPGVEIMGISGAKDAMYVAVPTTHPDFFDYQEAGVTIAGPEEPDEEAGVWSVLSWENADKYPADIILYDSRPGNLQANDLQAIPTFAALPAVEANQWGPWYVGQNYTWALYAEHTEELAAMIEQANDVA